MCVYGHTCVYWCVCTCVCVCSIRQMDSRTPTKTRIYVSWTFHHRNLQFSTIWSTNMARCQALGLYIVNSRTRDNLLGRFTYCPSPRSSVVDWCCSWFRPESNYFRVMPQLPSSDKEPKPHRSSTLRSPPKKKKKNMNEDNNNKKMLTINGLIMTSCCGHRAHRDYRKACWGVQYNTGPSN